jgi:hypothetical protein
MCFHVFPTATFSDTVHVGLLDFTSFRPYFSWMPKSGRRVRKTLELKNIFWKFTGIYL